jgi:hypothetical protein
MIMMIVYPPYLAHDVTGHNSHNAHSLFNFCLWSEITTLLIEDDRVDRHTGVKGTLIISDAP